MKKVFVFLLFALMVYLGYTIFDHVTEEVKNETYEFQFDEIDKDFWLISEWESFKRQYDLVSLKEGVLNLSPDKSGVVPYLLSRPIELQSNDVLTVKRRVKINHGADTFAGGFAFYQTDELEMIPEKMDGSWMSALGDGIVLAEYSYDLKHESKRPGKDVFRILAADWEYNKNYKILTPVYDEWFEETLIFDRRTNQITYRINKDEYKLYSYKMDKSAVRIMMHSFGTGSGNSVEVDWIKITVEDKSTRNTKNK